MMSEGSPAGVFGKNNGVHTVRVFGKWVPSAQRKGRGEQQEKSSLSQNDII